MGQWTRPSSISPSGSSACQYVTSPKATSCQCRGAGVEHELHALLRQVDGVHAVGRGDAGAADHGPRASRARSTASTYSTPVSRRSSRPGRGGSGRDGGTGSRCTAHTPGRPRGTTRRWPRRGAGPGSGARPCRSRGRRGRAGPRSRWPARRPAGCDPGRRRPTASPRAAARRGRDHSWRRRSSGRPAPVRRHGWRGRVPTARSRSRGGRPRCPASRGRTAGARCPG